MDMGRGQHVSGKPVLDLGQTLGQPARMMVIDQGNGAQQVLAGGPFLIDEAISDQVADEFRAVFIVAGGHQLFQLREQWLLD